MDTLVVSYGGVGTTMFLEHVSKYQETNDTMNLDGLKHLRVPPVSRPENSARNAVFRSMHWFFRSIPLRRLLYGNRVGVAIRSSNVLRSIVTSCSVPFTPTPRRAVYVFGDPIDAVFSIFRTSRTISGYFPYRHCYSLRGDLQGFSPAWDLEQYLAQGRDFFRIREHLDSWLHAKREYPILAVRFEYLWEHQDEVLSFLGLPSHATFPPRRDRQPSWREASPRIQEGLLRVYGSVQQYVQSLPPVIHVCP